MGTKYTIQHQKPREVRFGQITHGGLFVRDGITLMVRIGTGLAIKIADSDACVMPEPIGRDEFVRKIERVEAFIQY